VNCKKGDLAVIISGFDTGKIVTCVQLETPVWLQGYMHDLGPIWRVDRDLTWMEQSGNSFIKLLRKFSSPHIPDHHLRPLPPPKDVDAYDRVQEKPVELI